jgi:site-specific DNA-methyltransferase (adenine-specific)
MKKAAARKSSATTSFGTTTRESHDASRFYSSRMYGEAEQPADAAAAKPPFQESEVPELALDRILCASSEHMTQLPDDCLHLMVTSPPYNVGKDYDEDLSKEEYRALLRNVFKETFRVLVPGGRACVNVANIGRKPYIPIHSMIIEEMTGCGFLMRGEVIWVKGASSGGSCAWGSWQSAANPVLRDIHEYILVFSKQRFDRPVGERKSTIGRNEFLESTKSVWTFNAASARQLGHPAPFPEELPRRLINLYTFEGEVVLDPFAGSGTTCVAALKAGRHYVGYEIAAEYVALAERRLTAVRKNPRLL